MSPSFPRRLAVAAAALVLGLTGLAPGVGPLTSTLSAPAYAVGTPVAPAYDDAASTLTIPAIDGYEYLVNGAVTPPGPLTFTVPFGGLQVTTTVRATTGGAAPTPSSWVHTFPEVVQMNPPVFDDANLKVQTPGRSGVQWFVEGNPTALKSSSWNDLSAYAGQTVTVVARAAVPLKTLLVGTTAWVHTFPGRSVAPTFDDPTSTVTIPLASGVEYLLDGAVVPPGPQKLTVPFGGRKVTVTVRSTTGAPNPAPSSWTHEFPEVVEVAAPVFDDGLLRVQIPSRAGVQFFVAGSTTPLRSNSWNDLSAYAGQSVTIVASASVPRVTLLVGTTEWGHVFPTRPDYSIAAGDDFSGDGVAKAWQVLTEARPSKGKSVYRAENVTVHDGVLDIRIRRHCLQSDAEVVTDANWTEGVCPAGTITRYSTGRLNSGFIYGAPRVMEVRARLDAEHYGITSTGWMHNDQPFCTNGVTDTELAEFDVLEMWAVDYSSSFSHVTCSGGRYGTYGVRTDAHLTGDWHAWRVEWDGYSARYYLDGALQTGPAGPAVNGATNGVPQDRFAAAINDHQWQVVLNVNTPPDGGWAPWIDDARPFPEKHDLYDSVHVEPYTQRTCSPVGEIGRAAATRPDLGSPTTCEVDAAVPGARVQLFEHGRVYWSPATGAHAVSGPVLDAYVAAGGERVLGLPVADALGGLRDAGVSQVFQRATVFWSARSGAHWARGVILGAYAGLGWENSGFGYPVTDEVCGLRGGGCFQRFQSGDQIYWSPQTGAHFTRGAVFAKYAEQGFENGPLGYPVTDEVCGLRDGGCRQGFQGGTVYWSAATGAHWTRGAIFGRYAELGWESGFGYPTTDEICGLRGGCAQYFQAGAVFWSPATGAHWVRGSVLQRYLALGAESGAIGYPSTDEICGIRAGGCFQRFQYESGHIYWSPATGAWGVQGAIMAHYAANRWEQGRFGYATGPEVCADLPGSRECTQTFQGGRIVWSSATGSRG